MHTYTYSQVVRILLEEGADVNSANKDLNTPLLVGCAEGHTEVVKLLLSRCVYVCTYMCMKCVFIYMIYMMYMCI
jgi:hypothetical protein